jgi:hypothetical protein
MVFIGRAIPLKPEITARTSWRKPFSGLSIKNIKIGGLFQNWLLLVELGNPLRPEKFPHFARGVD